jgi:PAS domain S-box-containing protein
MVNNIQDRTKRQTGIGKKGISSRQKMFGEKTQKELEVIKQSADEAREYAESIIDTIREPLIVLDQDLRVISVSRSFYEVFKVKPEETVGQFIYDLGNKQWDIPKLRELLETILPQKATFDNYEVEHDFATIGRHIMLLNARQIQRVLGKERVILLAIEDITARRETENGLEKARKELERSNEELHRFGYVASHDLQEPLRMIVSYVQLLERRYKGKLDSDADDYINFAVDGAKRMQNLINDLLSYSRVDSRGKVFESTNMEKVFEAAMDNLQVAIEDSKAEVTHEPLPTVVADEVQMVQIFQNMVANAIKFHDKEAPRVHVSAELKENEWLFSVKDNGMGIEPQYFDRIFIIFQRLNGQEYSGTGLGLSIVKKIIERHGGRVWVESEYGKGSTFYFTIPKRGGK